MGIMLKKIHELQVNGETIGEDDDFNVSDDGAEADRAEAPADTANDAAEAENNEDTTTTDNDEEDDFVLDDDTEEDLDNTTEENEEGEQDNTDDNQADNTEDADDDFTVDGGTDTEGGQENETADEGNDTGTETKEEAPANPTDAISDPDSRAAEEEIYSSLTDDQKRIRVLQLKIDYKDLYETFINTLEGVNGIPTNADNIETIKRLVTLLTKAKGIMIDYISNNFDTNTYLENYTNYLKYLAVFRTASKVIEEMNKAEDK